MIGLYILTSKLLEKEKTIKFGMSMRLEYRWIDYLSIFNDSKYLYFYEILDNLSREDILIIEDEVIELHKKERNPLFQTEYFYCSDNLKFHQSVLKILNKYEIEYKIHNEHKFDRKYYDNPKNDRKKSIKINKLKIKNSNTKSKIITPYDYQQNILNIIEDFYNKNNIGKICWSCGLGKALLGILIIKQLNCKMALIGVPSIYLQKQMKNEILRIFNNHHNILFVGGESIKSKNQIIYSTNDDEFIKQFISKKTKQCKFIVTTYPSCHLLSDKYEFDIKVGDEAHHLVGSVNETTKFSFHNIKSKKTLFMTATEKVIEVNKTNNIIYSMDDESIFGKCIDTKSVSWAISHKKITDYNLIIIKNTEEEIDKIIDTLSVKDKKIESSIKNNKDLFLSAFMALKSIEKYHQLTHILIYTNKTENSELVKKFVDIILDLNIMNVNKYNYYNKALHSNIQKSSKEDNLSNELNKFKNSEWGIISSVYIFGEGFDCPKLNGVVFGENMLSDIRIVQSTLRPNRLDKTNPDKKAFVIIPYVDTLNFTEDNDSFDKCRKIIAKIRNVDETIDQKINVLSISNSENENESNDNVKNKYHHMIQNKSELDKIILRLRFSKALTSQYTEEQDEFNFVKQLNKELNITDKEEYTNNREIKQKHQMYIENPDQYFKLKGVWTDWYDFMGVDTNKFLKNKDEWIKFCKEKNVSSINDYKEKCKEYLQLPSNPIDFYKDFTSIPNELKLNRKRR